MNRHANPPMDRTATPSAPPVDGDRSSRTFAQRKMLRRTLIIFLVLSGWAIAAVASFALVKSLDSRDDAIQNYRDFTQLYFFLWEYARTHQGKLPNTLEEGLRGTGGMEPFVGMFTLLTPGVVLSDLPGNTPILKLKYPRKDASEVVMYPSGQIIYQVNKNGE